MALPDKVRRLLWSRSGGYCQNPACNCDIYVFFDDGGVSSIDELAHIIAESESGPRGDAAVPLDERNAFENLLVLCPKCHTIVDKNPRRFPPELLRQWKAKHEGQIASLFRAPKVSSRSEARELVVQRLRENKAIFDAYGPFSEGALTAPRFDQAAQWRRRAAGTLVPNNRFMVELLTRNHDLLTDTERKVADEFRLHQEAFEYNQLSGDKNAAAPLFPEGMNTIFKD